MEIFLSTFFMVFIAEMADKTQFLVIALTSKYKILDIIIGITVSILLLNGMSVVVGSAISNLFPRLLVALLAGLSFLCFAVLGLSEKKGTHEETFRKTGKGAVLAIAGAFFVAELGDKTQLAAISLAASNADSVVSVFWGTSCGLFVADMIGLSAGVLLGKKLPQRALNLFSFLIFTLFGFSKIYQPYLYFFGYDGIYIFIGTIFLFAVITFFVVRKVRIDSYRPDFKSL